MPIKQINIVKRIGVLRQQPHPFISIETYMPASPRLFWTCGGYTLVGKLRGRLGQLLVHGNRKWIPNVAVERAPDDCNGNNFIWHGSSPCAVGALAHWWVAQKQPTPPGVDWSSVLIPYVECDPPQAWATATCAERNIVADDQYSDAPFAVFTLSPGAPPLFDWHNLPAYGSYSVDMMVDWTPGLNCSGVTMRIQNRDTGLAIATGTKAPVAGVSCSKPGASVSRRSVAGCSRFEPQFALSLDHEFGSATQMAGGLLVTQWWDH